MTHAELDSPRYVIIIDAPETVVNVGITKLSEGTTLNSLTKKNCVCVLIGVGPLEVVHSAADRFIY